MNLDQKLEDSKKELTAICSRMMAGIGHLNEDCPNNPYEDKKEKLPDLENIINPGDKVILKSGGPVMTVSSMSSTDVSCYYFLYNYLQTVQLKTICLKKV